MRIVVTGRDGQVAMALRERSIARDHEVVALGRPDFDLTHNRDVIAKAIIEQDPDAIISAAAYTAVDKAESDQALAQAINVDGARAVALAAAQLGVPLLHLSTDYVFDGAKSSPYVESDLTCPQSVYGSTKRDGEIAVLSACDNSAVLRTAWVYSPFGSNFVRTMLRVGAARDEINVVSDQVGNPSSALDIADGCFTIAENMARSGRAELRGIFHLAGSGAGSWADFAEEVFRVSGSLGGPNCRVRRIEAKDYPTPARRPANSRLDCSKLEHVHGVRLPVWQKSLATVVERLVSVHQQQGMI